MYSKVTWQPTSGAMPRSILRNIYPTCKGSHRTLPFAPHTHSHTRITERFDLLQLPFGPKKANAVRKDLHMAPQLSCTRLRHSSLLTRTPGTNVPHSRRNVIFNTLRDVRGVLKATTRHRPLNRNGINTAAATAQQAVHFPGEPHSCH